MVQPLPARPEPHGSPERLVPGRSSQRPTVRRLTKAQRRDLETMWAEGYSRAEIADRLGISSTTVSSHIQRLHHQEVARENQVLRQMVDQLLAERETQTRLIRQLLARGPRDRQAEGG